MKKLLMGLFILIVGCSQNPVGPLPPIVDFASFDSTIENLTTAASVEIWLDEHVTYDPNIVTYLKYDGTDLCEENAKMVYETRRGSCGHYAAMYVYAARNHGIEAGGLVRPKIWIDGKGWFPGHLAGWVKHTDGRIYIVDNSGFLKRENKDVPVKSYGSLEELLQENPKLILLNEKFQEI